MIVLGRFWRQLGVHQHSVLRLHAARLMLLKWH